MRFPSRQSSKAFLITLFHRGIMSVLSRVKTVMIDKFGIDNYDLITPAFTFDDDLPFKDRFLEMIEFKMELEKEFDITIDDEDFDSIRTVDDLVNCIERINPKD